MGGAGVSATGTDRVRTRWTAPRIRQRRALRGAFPLPPSDLLPVHQGAGVRDYALANSRLSWYSFSEPRNSVLSMRP
jgi:hypothetical protein